MEDIFIVSRSLWWLLPFSLLLFCLYVANKNHQLILAPCTRSLAKPRLLARRPVYIFTLSVRRYLLHRVTITVRPYSPTAAYPPRPRQNRWYTTPFNYNISNRIGTSLSFLTVFRSLQRGGVSRALYLVSVVKSYQNQESLAVNYLSLSSLSLSLSSHPLSPSSSRGCSLPGAIKCIDPVPSRRINARRDQASPNSAYTIANGATCTHTGVRVFARPRHVRRNIPVAVKLQEFPQRIVRVTVQRS